MDEAAECDEMLLMREGAILRRDRRLDDLREETGEKRPRAEAFLSDHRARREQ